MLATLLTIYLMIGLCGIFYAVWIDREPIADHVDFVACAIMYLMILMLWPVVIYIQLSDIYKRQSNKDFEF